MKRLVQILFLGLLLSSASAALADRGHDRDGHRGGHRHHAHQYDRHGHRHDGHRHHARHDRHARRHWHHDRYCYDRHPRGYAAPFVQYGYAGPGFVIVYGPDTGLYLGGGR